MYAKAYAKPDRSYSGAFFRKSTYRHNIIIFVLVIVCLGMAITLKSSKVAFETLHAKYLLTGMMQNVQICLLVGLENSNCPHLFKRLRIHRCTYLN